MTRLFLIRHGESEWNCAQRYTGQRDVPLSELGQRQAERIAQRLAPEPLAAIYASPLQRARDTGNALAQAKQLPLLLEPDLAEIHHGQWEGLTACEVEEKFPEEYSRWRARPDAVTMPCGESLDDVARRVGAVFKGITSKHHDGGVAIFSHDAVLRVLLLLALDLPFEHFWKWHFENASLSIVEAAGSTQSFRLALLNDTTHLDGMRSDHTAQAL